MKDIMHWLGSASVTGLEYSAYGIILCLLVMWISAFLEFIVACRILSHPDSWLYTRHEKAPLYKCYWRMYIAEGPHRWKFARKCRLMPFVYGWLFIKFIIAFAVFMLVLVTIATLGIVIDIGHISWLVQ